MKTEPEGRRGGGRKGTVIICNLLYELNGVAIFLPSLPPFLPPSLPPYLSRAHVRRAGNVVKLAQDGILGRTVRDLQAHLKKERKGGREGG